jgi:hypothetical protein
VGQELKPRLPSTGEALGGKKAKSQRRVSRILGKLLELTDFALHECELLANSVERKVSVQIVLPE